jgi:hypothetical protein
MGSWSKITCLKPACKPASLVANDWVVSNDAGIVITAASSFSPGWIKVFNSFKTIADKSTGVLDSFIALILKLYDVPIFRLNTPTTLFGSFS